MKKIILFLLLIFAGQLRAEITISILTSSPGEEAHTIFGHSAVRVVDSDQDYDKLFNYGLFDFKTPFFPVRLLMGDLEYWLGKQTIERFIELNNEEGRIVEEQVLNLSQAQAQEIFADLTENTKSENKFYRYSFTQKNCATEIRDILVNHGLMEYAEDPDQSYRELINSYMQDHHWFRFGINLILGMKVEEKMSFQSSLFMPDNLYDAVRYTPDLVASSSTLNSVDEKEPNKLVTFLKSPWFIFSSLFLLSLFYSINSGN